METKEQIIVRADGKFELREHKSFNYSGEFGRANCVIQCPFCGAEVKVYVWSLAGGGKRCNCGALHMSGQTIKKLHNPKPIHPGKFNPNFLSSDLFEYRKKYNEWRKWEPKQLKK
jgi:hypothetical protein